MRARSPAFGRLLTMSGRTVSSPSRSRLTRSSCASLRAEGRLPDVSHPNVVPILDSDTCFADVPYVVMPYYPGGTLAGLLASHTSGLPEDRVESIFTGLLSGLAAAQRAGHRPL